MKILDFKCVGCAAELMVTIPDPDKYYLEDTMNCIFCGNKYKFCNKDKIFKAEEKTK